VVGSGYIAIELAGILASLGAKATLVLRGHKALKDFDSMLGECMVKTMRDEGIEVATGAWPHAIERTSTGHCSWKCATAGGWDPSILLSVRLAGYRQLIDWASNAWALIWMRTVSS